MATDTEESLHYPEPGDTLHNGATVVAIEKEENSVFLATVLCIYQGKYVTWTYNADTRGAAHGHYFGSNINRTTADDFRTAVEDFHERQPFS